MFDLIHSFHGMLFENQTSKNQANAIKIQKEDEMQKSFEESWDEYLNEEVWRLRELADEEKKKESWIGWFQLAVSLPAFVFLLKAFYLVLQHSIDINQLADVAKWIVALVSVSFFLFLASRFSKSRFYGDMADTIEEQLEESKSGKGG